MKENRSNKEIEEIFYNCKKVLRILKVFFEYGDEPLTMYRIEKYAAVYDSAPVIQRLLKLGIIIKVDEDPNQYVLNLNNTIVKKLKRFLRDMNYIP